MNYKKFFSDELISLKSQGLYRKFRAINRNKTSFPKATERFEGNEREVEVWCSNDYLNLSQHPEVTKTSVDVINELGTGSGGTRNISGNSKAILNLENEFYIQRALSGKTKSFSKENLKFMIPAGLIGTIIGYYTFSFFDKLHNNEFKFTPGIISSNDPKKDFKILRYNIDRNQDLIGKLERGAYSSVRYYVNPVSFVPTISVFNAKDYQGKANNLGDKEIMLPRIDDRSDKTLGDLPSRIFVGMLDVGTLEKDASDEGWNDPVKRNADPTRIHSQSMMRYNQIFTQVVDIQIPLNTNITAGSIIRCVFPQLSKVKRKQPDPEISGLYMIKELAHYFDGKGSYTKLKIVRDSFGRK